MISKTISHYRILEKLGEGGMGVVYKAQDTKLDRIVALKFLPNHLLCDSEAKIRFEHEAKAASALDHPNIATIYEIDEVEGECFISMAYVEGKSLKEILKEKTLSLREVLDIAIQVADGLNSAHKKDIVHRDIKSDNIMFTRDGLAKIMDFGLAKLKGATKLTKDGSTLGTLAYMSPEQAQGVEVDRRSDIFSFGVVLYELLTGKLPFAGEHPAAIIYSIINENPQPVARYNNQVSSELERIVFKALAKDKQERYQHIDDLLADLRREKKSLEYAKAGKIPTEIVAAKPKKLLPFIIPASVVFILVFIFIILKPFRFELRPGKEAIAKENYLAIMYFESIADPEDKERIAQMITALLITDLSESQYMQVMSRQRLYDILRLLGKEDLKVIDRTVASEIARKARVRWILTGNILQTEPNMVLTSDISEASTGKIIATQRVKGEKGEDIFTVVDKLSAQIKGDLSLPEQAKKEVDRPVTVLTTSSLEAYKYYLEGQEKAFRMYNQEAIEDLEEAISLDSTFVEAYDALARQYYTIGQPSKALELIQKGKAIATFSSKGTEETLFGMLALEALLEDEWDMAISYLKRVIRINPENIGAHGDLGYIYYRWKRMYDEGISEFKKVLELDPQAVTSYGSFTYNLLGWAYFRKGDLEKADAAFKKYVALTPDQAYPLNVLAEFYLTVGNYDQALTNLKRSYQINPDYPSTAALFGDTYLTKGMYSQAESCYRRYLVLSRGGVEKGNAHFSLGKLYYLKDEYEKATQECEQALKLNPQMIEALWIQGLIFVKKGRLEQAESLMMSIRGLIEKTKDEDLKIYYYHLSGELLFSKGFYEQAFQNLNQAALISYLDRTFFINALGEAYLRRGELNKAVEKFEEALQINSNCAQTLYLLGLTYEKQNKKTKAKACFQKFMEVWEEADGDLTQLVEVKRKLERL